MIELIRESIHNYNLLTIHSLNMVTSIIEEDFTLNFMNYMNCLKK